MRKALLVIAPLLLLASASVLAQDKITKRNGDVIEAKVVEVSTEEIKYRIFNDNDGPLYTLPKYQITKITYEGGRVENYQKNVEGAANKNVSFNGDKRAQNVFVEIGAQGLLFTANYDTRFGQRRDGLGGRAGAGFISVDDNHLLTVPLSLNYLLGKGNKFFEIGLGATYLGLRDGDDSLFDDSDSNVIGTMAFMYRYQPVDRGFSFRGGFTPIFNADVFLPYYFGFSLGYTF